MPDPYVNNPCGLGSTGILLSQMGAMPLTYSDETLEASFSRDLNEILITWLAYSIHHCCSVSHLWCVVRFDIVFRLPPLVVFQVILYIPAPHLWFWSGHAVFLLYHLPPFAHPNPIQSLSKMPSRADNLDYALTESQKAQFLEHGFIRVEKCFTPAQAADFTAGMWTRLGMSPTDMTTWTAERTNMPTHRKVAISEFAPKAWSAMCELLGGSDRISDVEGWGDGFIVNLGLPEYKADAELDLRNDLWGWHNDGDFFVHFLDSKEQALLVIPLWSDIVPVTFSLLLACRSMFPTT